MEDATLPRAKLNEALTQLEREDLDLFAVSDLLSRVERLQAEISRVQEAVRKKENVRFAADSLFTFSKS